MADKITRPSGLELTKVNDRTITWEYPPCGSDAKGMTQRFPSTEGDQWTVSNVISIRPIRPGEVTVIEARYSSTLKNVIEHIESKIAVAQDERQREALAIEQVKAQQAERACQILEDEQRLQEFMDDLFPNDD